jgi:hypothetical protein
VKYLTANKIADVLHSIATECYPYLTRDELMYLTSHLGREWAVVLHDEAGMNPDFIKSQLCWMGDLFRLYLQDTVILQTKHISALEQSSNEFMMLFGKNCTLLPHIIPKDDTMGSY